jgi:hypothetical protein
MPTPIKRAKYYRDLAAKCVQLADRATPDGLREFYRKLAGQYLKLVEAELMDGEEALCPRSVFLTGALIVGAKERRGSGFGKVKIFGRHFLISFSSAQRAVHNSLSF